MLKSELLSLATTGETSDTRRLQQNAEAHGSLFRLLSPPHGGNGDGQKGTEKNNNSSSIDRFHHNKGQFLECV